MPSSDDDKRISLRVSPERYAEIEQAAKREHRTVTGWVKALIASALEAGANTSGAGKRKR